MSNFKYGTVDEGKPREPEVNPSDVNEKELFHFKSVQTAFSNVDIKTTDCKDCEIRSKSQEELSIIMRKQEIIKRGDFDKGGLQQNLEEWFEIYSDKVKLKLWGEKLKKLAEKLQKPGGEEKLRIKIEKYLKQVPEQFSEDDDDRLEFRKQLPNDFLRHLKKMYINPIDTNIGVYRMELSNYCSRFKIENLRKAVLNWMKTLNIKKKDFLGRYVKRDDVFRYIAGKLEPLILERPKSDSEYKMALKSYITEIVDELPLVLRGKETRDKELYLDKISENLVNGILNIKSKFPSTYIQPTTKEIKEFVKDEITFFLEKSRVVISAKRMEYLETEMIDVLLDLTDVSDIDNNVVDDVTTLLKELGKLPEFKAKYFANLLLKDYREFYFRENFFQVKNHADEVRPDVYSIMQNTSDVVNSSETRLDFYSQRLQEEISKWITKLNIPNKNKNTIEVVVKDLASDIVDRQKYLLLNPSTKRGDADELEHLKFQIFKWTKKLVSSENRAVLEHAEELMIEINNIPKPSLQNTTVAQSTLKQDIDKRAANQSYIDILTYHIYDWYSELPTDIHVSQDASLNKKIIKILAENIEIGLNKKEDRVIDQEVDKWAKNVFDEKLKHNDVEQLKNIISKVPYTEENREKDFQQEKDLIRSYEDIVHEWIDTVPIAPNREGLFINNKNEIVHEIAVKICKIKTKLNHLPAEVIEKKLQEELSYWLKKLPLHAKVDKQYYRDQFAQNLVKNILIKNTKASTEILPKQTNDQYSERQIEEAILEWIKKNTLYRKKSLEEKVRQEAIIKELANSINRAIGNGDACFDKNIIKHIRMLYPKQNDDFVKSTANHLTLYLLKLNMLRTLTQQQNNEEKYLVKNIMTWLDSLPLLITDESRFKIIRRDFIASMKRLMSSGAENAVIKKQILIFMRALPMSRNKKDDLRYLTEKAVELIETLTTVPVGDVPRQSPSKNKEVICNVIKEWSESLPLKSVYCPRDLRDFIDDMSSVIAGLLLNPDYKEAENTDIRLHREIIKFLRRFPLQRERSTENHITRMAGELVKTLKETCWDTDDKKCLETNNITAYGLSMKNTNTTDNDFTIQSIKEVEINENLEKYIEQVVQQIGMWFDNIDLPNNVHKESYREVIINDLAEDIVDRHKYLELHPDISNTPEDELEHLKYQIFKWINKLVGKNNIKPIGNADDLMQRINTIPKPMLLRPQNKSNTQSHSSVQHKNSNQSSSTISINKADTKQLESDHQKSASSSGRASYRESLSTPQITPQCMNSPYDLTKQNSSNCCTQNAPPPPPTPDEGTKEAVYDKYQKIFREKCNTLPIDSSSPEDAKLTELAKTAIYNGIIKTFFNLKADPEIENDYGYFEFMLEEKIDELLDVLPQSEELIKGRHAWKLDILKNAINMLDELHGLSDRPSFRQRVRNKFNRKFAKDLELEHCFLLQQGFLAEIADAYILETNYKEKDPIKANIYKNRLMKKVDDLANHLSKEHNVGFRFFKKAQLARIAMKVLEQVPIPCDDNLQEEAEEIQLADEVEKWYKKLPTKPLVNNTDGVLRKRMMDLLAKKLYDMQKRLNNQDPSKETKIKHEISQFLEKRAQLQENQDLNINLMVDELNNRLKNTWLKEPVDYDDFEKDIPLSSTLAQVGNSHFLAPLMDATTCMGPVYHAQVYQESTGQGTHRDQKYFSPPGHPMHGVGQVLLSQRVPYRGNSNTNEMGSNQAYTSQRGHNESPPKRNSYAEILGMSNRVPNQSYISQQEAVVHGKNPNVSRHVPYGTRTSQVGAYERYIPQHVQNHTQEAAVKNMNEAYLNSRLFGTNQGPLTQHCCPRQNISNFNGHQLENPSQGYGAQQNPQMQNMTHPFTKNGRGALRKNHMVLRSRQQDALGENILTSQIGLQGQVFDQNMRSQIHRSNGPQGQMLFVPKFQGPSQGPSPMDFNEYLGSRGPLPSHGASTTAPVDPGGALAEDDLTNGGFHVKCRCLEALRRKRFSRYDERNNRYKPYKCPY